jgi:hypothetical protein
MITSMTEECTVKTPVIKMGVCVLCCHLLFICCSYLYSQKQCPSHLNEKDKVRIVLSDAAIEHALNLSCEATRGISSFCPNGMLCKDRLPRSTGAKIVLGVRKALWAPREDEESIGPTKRRERLEQAITGMLKRWVDGKQVVIFSVNSTPVCKFFYYGNTNCLSACMPV